MNLRDPSSITTAFLTAVSERLREYTAVFVSDNGRNQFSAVCLRLGGRQFAITAGHCVLEIEDRSSLRMATWNSQSPGLRIKPLGIGCEKNLDLGFVELEDSQATAASAKWLISEDFDSNMAQSRELAVMVGFPSAFFGVSPDTPLVVKPTPFLYISEVSDRWPTVPLDVPADKRQDFFVEWDKHRTYGAKSGNPIQPFNPDGMSGSGVFWVPRVPPDGVWSPHKMKLIGILSSTVNRDNLMRCTRAEHVLTIVQRAFAEEQESSQGTRESRATRRGRGRSEARGEVGSR